MFLYLSCSFCGAGGEESVFFVINDPLRDLTYCSLKFWAPFKKDGQSSCDGLFI